MIRISSKVGVYMNYLSNLNHITRDTWNDIMKKFQLNSILVFGSIVTEEYNEESDVDFAVIGQDILTLQQKLAMELILEDLLNREIDVIDLNDTSLDIFVKIQALNNGIVICTNDQEESLNNCKEQTEHYYRVNASFFAKRRRELLS